MTATLYCYFKAPSEPGETLDKLRALQAELAAAGWTGELLRRCDDSQTWMEVYPGLADREAFRSAWQAARLRHGLALPAREEWFQPL